MIATPTLCLFIRLERGHAAACAHCSTPTDPRQRAAVDASGRVWCGVRCASLAAGVSS